MINYNQNSHITFLRLEDVSKLLKIGKCTVYRYINENNFPKPIKLTERRSVWRLSDIEKWVEVQCSKGLK